MMKLFITGATGFIGKHLVKKLINEGHQVTINLYGKEISPFDARVLTYKLDENCIKRDVEYFKQESYDGIIHLASLYLIVHEAEDVVKLVDSNVRFSTYALECSSRAKTKWFINTGTFWQNYQNSDYSPVNLYAATKQAFESIAQYYIDTNQIIFCTLRISDTYGENDTRPKIFNLWSNSIINGKTLDMSPGEQEIDITYISDVIDAYFLLTKYLYHNSTKIINGSVYAVRSNQTMSLKELAKTFEEATGKILSINWGARSYRVREVMKTWKKNQVVPGWIPKISLIEGIKKTFKF